MILMCVISNVLQSAQSTKSAGKKCQAATTATWQRFNPSWNAKEHKKFYSFFAEKFKFPHVVSELIGTYAYQSTCLAYDSLLGITNQMSTRSAMILLNDQRHCAVGLWDGTVQIWDIEQKKNIDSRQVHQSSVTSLLELHSGLFASGSYDGSICVWDYEAKKDADKLIGHDKEVTALGQLASGDLVSASEDGAIIIWDPLTGNSIKRLTGSHTKRGVNSFIISPQNFIIAFSFRSITTWNPDTGKYTYIDGGNWSRVPSIFLSDGTLVFSEGYNSIQLRNLQQKKSIVKISLGCEPNVLSFLSEQDRLLVGCNNGRVLVIDAITKKIIQKVVVPRENNDICGMIVIPGGRLIVSCRNGTLHILTFKIPEVVKEERHCIVS